MGKERTLICSRIESIVFKSLLINREYISKFTSPTTICLCYDYIIPQFLHRNTCLCSSPRAEVQLDSKHKDLVQYHGHIVTHFLRNILLISSQTAGHLSRKPVGATPIRLSQKESFHGQAGDDYIGPTSGLVRQLSDPQCIVKTHLHPPMTCQHQGKEANCTGAHQHALRDVCAKWMGKKYAYTCTLLSHPVPPSMSRCQPLQLDRKTDKQTDSRVEVGLFGRKVLE